MRPRSSHDFLQDSLENGAEKGLLIGLITLMICGVWGGVMNWVSIKQQRPVFMNHGTGLFLFSFFWVYLRSFYGFHWCHQC